MAALPPRSSRRRPRRGSLERPVSGRLYRGTWLLVGIPAASGGLQRAQAGAAAGAAGAAGLLRRPERHGARLGALAALPGPRPRERRRGRSRPVVSRPADPLRAARGSRSLPRHAARPRRAHARQPGRDRPGPLARTRSSLLAHRDDSGTGPGANNNASGIAALIQLVRSYGTARGARPVSPQHTLVFVATDGGAFGDLGARRFAETHPGHIVAAVVLNSIASRGRPRLVLIGSGPRLASPGFVETAAQRVVEQTGRRPEHPGALAQLVDLGFPFTLHEQGPLLAQGIPALTLTSGGERPPNAFTDQPGRLDQVRLAELGRATQQLVRWLDAGAELAPGTARYVYFGPRVLPGWAIELVLLAALLPFLVSAVDLFARCRRRHISADTGAAQLPQPSRLLALGGDPVRAVRADRHLAVGARGAAAARRLAGDELAGDRRPGARVPLRARLAGRRGLAWRRAGRSRRPRSSPERPARCSPWRSLRCSSWRRIRSR